MEEEVEGEDHRGAWLLRAGMQGKNSPLKRLLFRLALLLSTTAAGPSTGCVGVVKGQSAACWSLFMSVGGCL